MLCFALAKNKAPTDKTRTTIVEFNLFIYQVNLRSQFNTFFMRRQS